MTKLEISEEILLNRTKFIEVVKESDGFRKSVKEERIGNKTVRDSLQEYKEDIKSAGVAKSMKPK